MEQATITLEAARERAVSHDCDHLTDYTLRRMIGRACADARHDAEALDLLDRELAEIAADNRCLAAGVA